MRNVLFLILFSPSLCLRARDEERHTHCAQRWERSYVRVPVTLLITTRQDAGW